MPGGDAPIPRMPAAAGATPASAPADNAAHEPSGPGHESAEHDSHRASDPRELWPRDFGRDGVSGLVTSDRAMRARDVSRPSVDDELAAQDVLADLLARVEGRRPAGPRTNPGP